MNECVLVVDDDREIVRRLGCFWKRRATGC